MSNYCAGESGISHDMQLRMFGHCDACDSTEPNPLLAAPMPTETTQPTPVRAPDAIEIAGDNVIAVTNPTDNDELTTYTYLKGDWR